MPIIGLSWTFFVMYRLNYVLAGVCSIMTTGSSPTTQASWPGGTNATSPGPYSVSFPSICTIKRPDMCMFRCGIWQVSVLAVGLTSSDHFHPGWKVSRRVVVPPTFTTSTVPRPGLCCSSGVSKLLLCSSAISSPPIIN